MPRILVPKQGSCIKVNTKTMLHASLDNSDYFFFRNFDHDTTVQNINAQPSGKDVKSFKWDTIFPKYDFKIIIDTSYTIAARGFEYKNSSLTAEGYMDFGKVFSLLKEYVVCYPLLIYNNEKKSVYSNQYIKLIQEAKDTDGNWKPIEFYTNAPSCIPYGFFYEYHPKKYSSLSILKYHGDFKTKLRVKIRIGEYNYYSNEINGTINVTQFNQEIAKEKLKFFCHLRADCSPVSKERLQTAFLKNVP